MHYSAVFEYIATTICFLLVTHITNSATILLLLLLLVWFLIIGNYTARGERFENCGLNSNACVAAALTSPQYRSRMLSIVCLFTILCLLVNVSALVTIVWARGFDY